MKKYFILLFVIVGFCFTAVSASAATIYSNSSTGNDTTGDGTSGTPYKTFHKAYTSASTDDTLDLTGTFNWADGDESGDASYSGYTIGKNIIIQGQGSDQTIIQAASTALSSGKRVFTISAGYSLTILDANIRYGYPTSYNSGGCILVNSTATLTINRSEVNNCKAQTGYGGGIYASGNTTIIDSAIHSNGVYYDGAGIVITGGANLILTNSTVYNNVGSGNANYNGGGILVGANDNTTATATITNSTITDNYARYGGGGIYLSGNADLRLYIKNSIVAQNDSNNGGNYNNIFKETAAVITSNGYNIIGGSNSYTAAAGDWTDQGNDGTFELYSVGTTGSLNLDATPSYNDSSRKTYTYGILSGSVAINNSNATANNGVSIPSTDQRNATRAGAADIGAFEYNGTGLTVIEPSTQTTDISFTLVDNEQLALSWTNGNGDKRVIFAKQASSGTASPVDGTSYSANSVLGSGDQIGETGWYTIYNGVGTSVTLTGLTDSTSYIFQAFEHNGITDGTVNYFTDSASNNPKVQATHTPTTIYVNYSTGNDSTGDGSSGTPYKTFYKAYTMSSGGDTLDLTGTFDWSNADETGDASSSGYTIGKDIIIQGQGADQTIIQAASTALSSGKRVFTISAGYSLTILDANIRYGYPTSYSSGGCILVSSTSTLTMNRSEVNNCKAQTGYGGGIYAAGDTTITDSSIYSNSVYYDGAGIVITGGANLILTNSTVYDNIGASYPSYNGGGILIGQNDNATATATITNCTITGNYTPYGGGGIYLSGNAGLVLNLKNSIVAGNSSNNGGQYNNIFKETAATITSNGYNVVGASKYFTPTTGDWGDQDNNGTYDLYSVGTTGSLNLDSTPSYNDSSRKTYTYGILSGSVAINNSNATANNGVGIPSTDQRNATRAGAADIGAFEYNGTGLTFIEPSTQTTEISFTLVDNEQLALSWTNGNGDKRVVFAKQASSGTASPVDGTSYSANSILGSGDQIGETGWYAIYNGVGTSVTMTGLTDSTSYIFQAFEHNGVTDGTVNYFTDSASNNPKVQATHTPITIYVNYSTGNDSTGDGTSGTPYKTFHKAYTMSSGGDTLDLTGTFDWSNADETGDVTTSGYVIDKDLILQGQSASTTFIQAASSAETAGKKVFSVSGSYDLTIQDLNIRYGYPTTYTSGGCINVGGTATLTMNRSEVNNCKAYRGYGGGIYASGDTTITNSSIYSNGVYYDGAGIVITSGADLIMTNSTVYNNIGPGYPSYNGGGILVGANDNTTATATITNCTITGNYTPYGGGGIYVSGNAGLVLNLKNTIVAGNTSNNGGQYNNVFKETAATITSNGYNIVGASKYYTAATGDWTDQDNNGTYDLYSIGTTGSLNLDSSSANNDNTYGTLTYGIQSSSIAINNANATANNGVSIPSTDQRGAGRNSTADIGAFEYDGDYTITQPTTQASSISFSSVNFTQIDLSWTAGNGSKNIVFVKQANTGTASPVDESNYTANAAFGSGSQISSTGWYAVYDGTGTSVTLTGLSAGTDYIAQVFTYNGITSGGENYFTDTATNNPNTQATAEVTEPTTQATNITFSSIAYTQMTIGWSNGDGTKRVVFVKQANTGTATPVDDTVYTANTTFGSGTQISSTGWYAVYNNTGTSVTITGLTAGTDYIAQVFEYDSFESTYDYFTETASNNPKSSASTSVTTPSTQTTNISFSSVGYTQTDISWSNGNGDARIVFLKEASTGTASPVDDTTYSANAAFESGTQIGSTGWYTVYSGTGTSVTVTGLSTGTTYIAQVFEYNTSGALSKYFTDSASNNPKTQATNSVTEPTTQSSNVSFSSVTGTGFTTSWTNGNGDARAVFIKQASSGTAEPVDDTTYTANTAFSSGTQIGSTGWYCVYNGTSTNVSITGLSSSATYQVQVFEYNGDAGIENYLTDSASNNPKSQATASEVQIGEGTGSQNYLPWANYYRYSYSQMIYTSSDIGSNGSIDTIKFKYNGNNTYTWNNMVVYMGHTDKATFSSGSDWVAVGDLTQVYSGSVSVTAGASAWDTITLDSEFEYNGSDNLIIAIDNNHGSYTSSSSKWYYTSASNTFIYRQSDSVNYSPSSPGTGTLNSYRPNIILNLNPLTHSLSYSAGDNGSISGTTSQTIEEGSNGTAVTAVPSTGYQFVSWSDGSTANPRTDLDVSEDVTVSASFATRVYTLTYSAGVNGSLTGVTPQNVAHNGTALTVTAVANSGYVFSTWSDGILTAARTDSSVIADATLTATFIESTPYIYVNSSTGNDNVGNGTSGNPYKTFHKAYTQAENDYVIDLTGTFDWTNAAETGDAKYTGYSIAKDLTIRGQGSDATIIQAASADNIADRRIFTIAANTTVTIQDLAIRYGKIDDRTGTALNNEGGGILNLGTVTVNDCEIYNNRVPTGYGGGGLSNRHLMTINDSAIYNNIAYYMGGGVLNSYTVSASGYLTITNSTIYSNQVTQVIAYTEGGGVHFRKGNGTITNTTVTKNTACGVAGVGMDDANGTVKLKNNIFAGNLQKVHSYCSNGAYPKGFDFRQSGYGNVVDGGNNIIGGYAQNYNFTVSTDWTDTDRDGTFTKYGTETTGTINFADAAALNSSPNKTKTFAVTESSIAINNGSTGTNGNVTVSTIDQRGAARSGTVDIGAYEYGGQFLNTYTLTYLSGLGGYISGTALQENVPEDANGTAVTPTPNTGYEFVDWSDEATDNPRTDSSVSANVSVTANFQVITYDLSYSAGANGSLTGTTSQTVNYGSNGTAVTAVPADGYNFIGWSDGVVTNPRTDSGVTADATVTASFASNSYNLIYTAGANGSLTGTATQLVTSGADGSAVTAVPATGYAFVNWSDSSTANPRTDTSVGSNLSVTANFSTVNYTLTYSAGSNGSLTGTASQTVSYAADGTAVTAVPSAGYSFVNWSDASTDNPRTDTSISGDVTVTANFSMNTFTLTYTVDYRGTLTGSASQTINYGENGTAITAVANSGFTFFRWSDGSTNNPRTDTNITSNKSVRAYFILAAFTSAYTAGTNGTLVGQTSQSSYYAGSNRPVVAIPNEGYTFLSWSDGVTTDKRTDLGLSENINVTANFALKTYSLEYTAGANGSVTGTTSQTINYGDTGSAITAVPNSRFSFVKWSDGSITNPRTDTGENINVNAVFGVDRYALTYVAGSNGTVTGTTSQTLSAGENGTAITATPNSGYAFSSWSDSSTDNPRTDTNISSSMYLTANFTINTFTLSYSAGDNGSLTGTTSQSVNYSADSTAVTAVPDSGYHFVNWSDGSAQNPRTDVNVSANVSISATFAENRAATTIYVNNSTGNDTTGDGSSDTPYKTFHKGYIMSATGDILDLTGTFTWTDAAEIGDYYKQGYVLTKNLTVQGQGADTTIIQAASRDNSANRRVFTVVSGATVTFQNLTVRYGRVFGYQSDGGGIRNDGITTIDDCEIYNNRSASDSGGGISNRHTLTVTNSSIYNNVAYYMGGGIVNSFYVDPSGYLTVTNSTIAYNQQTTGIAYTEGGGIHIRKGSATITNSTIAYNTATGVAGLGIDDSDGTITIKNTIIANNIKRNSDYYVDFGFRASGQGNVVDNGNNIVGVSQNYTWSGTGDWSDVDRDGTFLLNNSITTGSLNLNSYLAFNGNTNKTKTLSVSTGSVAIDYGTTGTNGAVSVPTADQRDFIRESTPDIGSFEFLSAPDDTTDPVISDISSTPTSTTAVITWTTDEATSSQIIYDPNQIRSTASDVSNVDTGVTSHEITLSDLVSCTKYYYVVTSTDSSGNTALSAENTFITTGCAGNASVGTINETTAIPEYGGTINQSGDDFTFAMTIPESFSEDPADFQIKSLDSATVISALSSPTNYNKIGDNIFDIKALDTPSSTVSEFDSDVEITITYDEEDIAGLQESTLKLHRNDDDEWFELADCVVDPDANSVTCSTNNFSVVGLFGEAIAYNLTYIAGSNGSITGTTEQTIDTGENGTEVTAVPENGYQFSSWSDESLDNPRTDLSASADITVTANFTISGRRTVPTDNQVPVQVETPTTSPTDDQSTIRKEDETIRQEASTDRTEAQTSLNEGKLIKYPDSPKIYLIENGKKRWIVDEFTFNQREFDWSKINEIDSATQLQDGESLLVDISIYEEKLIKYPDAPNVYLIENNLKRWIVDEYSFNHNDYDWTAIQELPNTLIFSDGENILYEEPATIELTIEVQEQEDLSSRNLEEGMAGEDVRALQKYLNDNGFIVSNTDFGSPGNESTFFGQKTQSALIKFQEANNIFPAKGFYGPVTRGYINL